MLSLIGICVLSSYGYGQKQLSECTIIYNYAMGTSDGKEDGPSKTTAAFYIKGNMSRSENHSALASFSIIHDANAGTAVVLRELSGQKLLIRMNAENWADRNKRYEGLRFTTLQETKTIAGYNCLMAKGITRDSLSILVYYSRDLRLDNKDYDPQFKNLDGLPLEYYLTKGKLTIHYVLSSINLNPVPASRFDIPTAGYREMTYEESKKYSAAH